MTTNITNLPEYCIIDSTTLRLADKEVIEDVHTTLRKFIEKRDKVISFLNQNNISKLDSLDLNILVDQVAKLAAGRESNFVKKQYRVYLVQLSFQLGFLFKELYPEHSMGNIILMKMNNISTRDVSIETKVLDSLLKEFFPEVEIPLVNTEQSDRVRFWNIEATAYFLSHLLELGDLFSKSFQARVK